MSLEQPTLLRTINLSHSFGSNQVLRDVNFELKSGEFVCLLGKNGAGKSTLLELVAGILATQKGEVLLHQRALHSYRAEERARSLALVGHETPTHLSARQVVQLGRLPHRKGLNYSRDDAERTERALSELDCLHFCERNLHTLSDGERARVHWARALCQEPRILLLDEATAHLDLAHRESSFERAKAFSRDGRAVFAVAHDVDLALRYADRVVILHEGRVRVAGPPTEVLSEALFREVFGVHAEISQVGKRPVLIIHGRSSQIEK